MNETPTTDNKKDGGIKVTLSLDNEMLAQMISKGIQDLPNEVVHTLSYEALKTALQDKEFLKHLMFVSSGNSYNWWETSKLRQWVVDLLSRSFTDKEVKEFRDGMLHVLRTDHRQIAVDAMTSCFMHRLSDFDFDAQVRHIIGEMMNEGARR